MSAEKPATRKPEDAGRTCKPGGASIGRVLQEVAGAPHTWQELSPEATQALFASLKENSIAVQFEATQHLSGNQGFVLSKKDAVRLAQLLLAEPEDGSSVMSDDHRDAVGELFRQFAGAAASALKGLAGGEVSFKWVGLDPFPGAARRTGRHPVEQPRTHPSHCDRRARFHVGDGVKPRHHGGYPGIRTAGSNPAACPFGARRVIPNSNS